MKYITTLFVLLVATSAAARLNVVATLPDFAAVARDICQQDCDVTVLANNNQDPHFVDPRPSLLVPLSRADVIIVNGLQLEAPWLTPLLQQARNSKVLVGGPGYIDASTMITPLRRVAIRRVDRSMGDVHPGGNPHYAFSARAMAEVAKGMASRFAALDSEHSAALVQRGEAVAAKYRAFADASAARFAKLSDDQRQVVSYHASLIYFLDWLGVKDVTQVEPRPGIPPNPKHTAEVLRTMKAKNVHAIVQERFYPSRVSATLAKLAGGTLVLIEGGADFAKGEDYLTGAKHRVDALYDALK